MLLYMSGVNSEPNQTFKLKLIAKTVNGFKTVYNFHKKTTFRCLPGF